MQWTPELKAQVIKMYTDAEPTPDTSVEIIKDIADDLEASVNGVRMIIVQAGVYVKKEAEPTAKDAASKSGGAKRVSKESAINELRDAIKARNAEIDEDILGKLTGKAAQYFVEVLKA